MAHEICAAAAKRMKSGRGSFEMKDHRGLRRPVALMARIASRALRLRGEEGGSLVELAIFAPLLFLILGGSAAFTLAFFNLQQIGNATAAAVQTVAAEQGVTSDPCNLAMTTIQGEMPGFTKANITYTLTVGNSSGNTSYSTTGGANGGNTGFSCQAAVTSNLFAASYPVSLQVSYSYTWLPVLFPSGRFWKMTPSSTLNGAPAYAMAD